VSVGVWVQGARPRTLGAAVSPVAVGTAVAARQATVLPGRAGLALAVALALQVGVNYANDYSDGVRGVDVERRGPVRLTGSGLAAPAAVKRAAIASFVVAALAGIVLAILVDLRLVAVGAVCVLAGAAYSGGPKPYASAGLGEVMVLVFFGFVATCGATYAQLERVPALAVAAAIPVGLLACAILLANNLRDVDTDRAAGKRTLAVRVGAERARRLFGGTIVGAFVGIGAVATVAPGALLALGSLPLGLRPLRAVRPADDPASLAGLLPAVARLQLVLSLLLAVGLSWSR